jgi:transposase
MSQTNTNHTLFVGLDVAKSSLQLHLAGQFHRLTNNAKGHQQLLKLLRDHCAAHVICEASGGYEQSVLQVLHAAALPVSLIEAGRIRHFAKAKGLRAKTDPIDAAVLSHYGQAVQPPPTPPRSAQQLRLVQLSTRRQQLIDVRVSERNRAGHYSDPFSQKQSKQLLSLLDKQINRCDKELLELIAQDQALQAKAQRLDAIPGVGATTAAIVLAQMPELGQLSSQAAAALAGLAPYNHDSGSQTGVRHIYGGRKAIRCALYMAALSAVRYDRILKAFYLRLRLAGKKPLVALTACMRKLIVLMNRLLKNTNFQLAN